MVRERWFFVPAALHSITSSARARSRSWHVEAERLGGFEMTGRSSYSLSPPETDLCKAITTDVRRALRIGWPVPAFRQLVWKGCARLAFPNDHPCLARHPRRRFAGFSAMMDRDEEGIGSIWPRLWRARQRWSAARGAADRRALTSGRHFAPFARPDDAARSGRGSRRRSPQRRTAWRQVDLTRRACRRRPGAGRWPSAYS